MTIGVGTGLAECPFSDAAGFWRWVDMCEAGGVDSIWQTDRLVSRHPMLECMSVMAALAGRTQRMRFGMNVVSLALRDPVLCAKQCATIDFLSGGRLLPAFGIGSPLAPEWAAMNLNTKTRGRVTDEALDVIARLWRDEVVDYDGRHFQLRAASIAPKPVQAELPMWMGGASKAAIERTARIGTGWIGGVETPAQTAPIVAAIREAAMAAERSIDDDHYGASFPFYFGRFEDPVMEAPVAAYRL
ncbi:MAG: LLM class flavin-dependent oxidoreductase, partial [Alphaproteobacteria bacterium]|nr:LLM class flavin-dependent oxidoreductase [Alphaproteobacteria bacterium]